MYHNVFLSFFSWTFQPAKAGESVFSMYFIFLYHKHTQTPWYSGHRRYTGDRSSIPAYGDSLGKWMNLRLDQPMPCEGNWVVSPRCWRDIDLQSVYNCENGLLSLLQFNHIENIEQRERDLVYYCYSEFPITLEYLTWSKAHLVMKGKMREHKI